MFTGIVTDVGRVVGLERRGDARFEIETGLDLSSTPLGASIAVSGVCLTVVERSGRRFSVDVSAETLSRTTLGSWEIGRAVNLEASLKVGDELGGHLVSGHVDGLGRIESRRAEGDSWRFRFFGPRILAPFIAEKGSLAVDGVSLTVNDVEDQADAVVFGINIIPHTAAMTTFGASAVGDSVNLEIDMVARYLRRALQVESRDPCRSP